MHLKGLAHRVVDTADGHRRRSPQALEARRPGPQHHTHCIYAADQCLGGVLPRAGGAAARAPAGHRHVCCQEEAMCAKTHHWHRWPAKGVPHRHEPCRAAASSEPLRHSMALQGVVVDGPQVLVFKRRCHTCADPGGRVRAGPDRRQRLAHARRTWQHRKPAAAVDAATAHRALHQLHAMCGRARVPRGLAEAPLHLELDATHRRARPPGAREVGRKLLEAQEPALVVVLLHIPWRHSHAQTAEGRHGRLTVVEALKRDQMRTALLVAIPRKLHAVGVELRQYYGGAHDACKQQALH